MLHDYDPPILLLVGRVHLFFSVLLNGHACRFNKATRQARGLTGLMFGGGGRLGEVSRGQI